MDEGKNTRGRGRPQKKLDPPTDALGRFANHVRSGRAIAGMKQTELADRVGCTPGSLSQIERGILRPSPALATALDQALGWNGLLLSLFRDAQDEKDRKTADRIGRPTTQRPANCLPGPHPRICTSSPAMCLCGSPTSPSRTGH